MTNPGIDLGAASALINAFAALAVLYMMQAVTGEAGFGSRLAFLKFLHRVSLGALAIILAAHAYATITYDREPLPIDVLVQAGMLVALLLSALRHAQAPRPPTK